MELLKISDNTYVPIHRIIRISRNANYIYIYYEKGDMTDYYKIFIRDYFTLEQELQARLINVSPTKGFTNAI